MVSRAEQEALQWNLARVRSTRDGIFEYLQAAQDIARFQEDLLQALEESWQEAYRHQPPRNLPRGQLPLSAADVQLDNLLSSFLYRSPTLTLLVMPEQVLPDFYQQLIILLEKLRLSHSVRIVACRHNQPVWMALRDLGVHESFIPSGTAQRTEVFGALRSKQQELNASIDRLEPLRRQLQGELDRLTSRGQPLPEELRDLRERIGKANDFIRIAGFIVAGEAAHQAQQWAKMQPATEEKGKLDKPLTELLTLRAEAINQARQVQTAGESLLRQAGAARAASRSSHTLTVLRSGVQRNYTGPIVSFLLETVPQNSLRAAHQLGSLAEYSQGLLEKVRALPEKDETFWRNFGLEWETRTRRRGKERLPAQVKGLVEEGTRLLEYNIDQVPGLLLEIALRQQDTPSARAHQRRET